MTVEYMYHKDFIQTDCENRIVIQLVDGKPQVKDEFKCECKFPGYIRMMIALQLSVIYRQNGWIDLITTC